MKLPRCSVISHLASLVGYGWYWYLGVLDPQECLRYTREKNRYTNTNRKQETYIKIMAFGSSSGSIRCKLSWCFDNVVKIGGYIRMPLINVALLNGHAELFTFLPSSTVQDVRIKAQRAFGQKCLRLITSKKRVLVDFEQTLEEAEIEDGECLTALVLQPKLAATRSAFALWCHGGSSLVT